MGAVPALGQHTEAVRAEFGRPGTRKAPEAHER